MQSEAVVPHRNVVHYILLGLVTRFVVTPLYTLLLQATKEAFCDTIDAPMSRNVEKYPAGPSK